MHAKNITEQFQASALRRDFLRTSRRERERKYPVRGERGIHSIGKEQGENGREYGEERTGR